MSLIANYLEASGIPTVIMGCAKDIVEYCGVPRFLFSDFPLGCPTGRPDDRVSQRGAMELALRLLECAPGPRTTAQLPQRWSDNSDWRVDFMAIAQPSKDGQPRRGSV